MCIWVCMNKKWQKQDSARRKDLFKYSIFSKIFLELLEAPWKHHVFSSSRWTTREAAFVKPTSSNIFRQWICYICCIAGQKMERWWALLSLFSSSRSKLSPTPWISYWTWPTGQATIPHFQQAGGGWVAPLAAHAGSSTPLLAPRGFLQSGSSCSGLSPLTRFVISVSLWHIHTRTAAASGLGGLGSSFLWSQFCCTPAGYIAVGYIAGYYLQ